MVIDLQAAPILTKCTELIQNAEVLALISCFVLPSRDTRKHYNSDKKNAFI